MDRICCLNLTNILQLELLKHRNVLYRYRTGNTVQLYLLVRLVDVAHHAYTRTIITFTPSELITLRSSLVHPMGKKKVKMECDNRKLRRVTKLFDNYHYFQLLLFILCRFVVLFLDSFVLSSTHTLPLPPFALPFN